MEKIRYKKGYKYQLNEDYKICLGPGFPAKDIRTDYIEVDGNGTLLIRKGYAWDGPSGLTIDTKSSMRGSLVHDALYQLMRLELLDGSYRESADGWLWWICLDDGMWLWRANLWYNAVRAGAGYAADPKNRRKVLTAP